MDALTRDVAAAMREAAERAILPHYQSLAHHEIVNKAADDVVTVADHESEAILADRLSRLLPEAAIVGEEAAHADPATLARLGDALCWIIDPLDGTNNFAQGKPPFYASLDVAGVPRSAPAPDASVIKVERELFGTDG